MESNPGSGGDGLAVGGTALLSRVWSRGLRLTTPQKHRRDRIESLGVDSDSTNGSRSWSGILDSKSSVSLA